MIVETFFKDPPRKPKRRKPMPFRSAKGQEYEDAYHAMAEKVCERARGMCEDGCGRRGDVAHHRKRRSQRGPNTMRNLIWLADVCHARVHAHPAESYANGLLIHRDAPITPYLGRSA